MSDTRARRENTDELIARMELEDKLDAAQAGVAKLSVVEYARARGMAPQNVYYYIRTHKIVVEVCICGRKVIDVKSADDLFAEIEAKRRAREKGA